MGQQSADDQREPTNCWPHVHLFADRCEDYPVNYVSPQSSLAFYTGLPLQISIYTNSSIFWFDNDPILWPKIPLISATSCTASSKQYAITINSN